MQTRYERSKGLFVARLKGQVYLLPGVAMLTLLMVPIIWFYRYQRREMEEGRA